MARRLLRAAAHVLVALAVPLSAGAAIQAYVEHDQRGRFPPPGELVDLGDGRHLHLRTWGQDDGGPTILLDVSATLPSSTWTWIAQDLARDFRVVAYDRPGMGWSRGGEGTRDARSAADALNRALAIAGIDPPYVMIGHSYGGFSARVFADLRRDDVAALVLLDTTHPDGGGGRAFALFYRLRAWQGHLGLFQLSPPGNDFAPLPVGEGEAAYAVSLWTSHLDASADEMEAFDLSAAQVRAAGSLGDLPLLVVSGIGSPAQVEMQRDLAGLSTAARFAQLDVWHVTMLTRQDEAAVVTAEIRRFLDESGAAAKRR